MMTSQTLDKLPLTYNLDQSLHKMGCYRTSREKQSASLQRVQAHSHYLYTHGRSLFEDAVTRAATLPSDPSTCHLPCIQGQRSNPVPSYIKSSDERSLAGSKRHSDAEMSLNRARVLHAIRHCSLGNLHSQLEEKSVDAIKHHIQRLNDTLCVDFVEDLQSTDGNIRQTPTTCFSEVVLVPLYTIMPREVPSDKTTLFSGSTNDEGNQENVEQLSDVVETTIEQDQIELSDEQQMQPTEDLQVQQEDETDLTDVQYMKTESLQGLDELKDQHIDRLVVVCK